MDFIGKTVGNFKVIREIGRGANGIVYLAIQISLDRPVALKVLFADKAREKESVDRFFREARAAAMVNSEYIVQSYDIGIDSHHDTCFFAMELVEGITAEDCLKDNSPQLTEVQVWEIAMTVAMALAEAHDKCHFIHGDIKPANILIRHDGVIKLADLGLAKIASDADFDEIMATPAYAAPELIRGEIGKFGVKSDMYSFGVMLYELLAGKPPFEGDSDQVLVKHLDEIPPGIGLVRPDISSDWNSFIAELLAKDPEDRPVNWESVVRVLEKIRRKNRKNYPA